MQSESETKRGHLKFKIFAAKSVGKRIGQKKGDIEGTSERSASDQWSVWIAPLSLPLGKGETSSISVLVEGLMLIFAARWCPFQ